MAFRPHLSMTRAYFRHSQVAISLTGISVFPHRWGFLMRRRPILLAAAALGISCLAAIQPAQAKPAAVQLDMYTVRATAAEAAALVSSGLDVDAQKPAGGMTEAQIVLS